MSANTEVYKICEDGEIRFHASYSLEPRQALKCAVLQHKKIFNTWMYDQIDVHIEEAWNHLVSGISDNEAFCVELPDKGRDRA